MGFAGRQGFFRHGPTFAECPPGAEHPLGCRALSVLVLSEGGNKSQLIQKTPTLNAPGLLSKVGSTKWGFPIAPVSSFPGSAQSIACAPLLHTAFSSFKFFLYCSTSETPEHLGPLIKQQKYNENADPQCSFMCKGISLNQLFHLAPYYRPGLPEPFMRRVRPCSTWRSLGISPASFFIPSSCPVPESHKPFSLPGLTLEILFLGQEFRRR